MALVLKDRVLETCTAPGTGTVTLLGATAGYQTFSAAIGNGNTTYYTIADQSGSNWEVGVGTYTTSGNTLTRNTVLSSSNGGSLVNFNSGTQNVFVTYPSEKAVYTDAAGNITPSTFSSITDSGLTSGRVTYAGTGGLLQDSANMTFNGTTLTLANDASISGLTVGKGGGASATNTAVGSGTFVNNSSGTYNVAFGLNALYTNSSASFNSAFGVNSLFSNTTGTNGSAFGNGSLQVNTTGSYNVAFGDNALHFNTTASNNTAVGYQAGYSNTTGTNITALGYQAGYSSTSNQGTYIGTQAGYGIASTVRNTCLGYQAGYSAASDGNTFVGNQAGYNSTGSYNLFIGCNNSTGNGSGYAMTTGSANTILGGYSGNQGGLDIRTSSNYIVLSDGAGNPRIISDSSGNVGIGTTTPSTGSFNKQLTINSGASTYAGIVLQNNTTGSAYNDGVQIATDGTNALIYNYEAGNMIFSNAGSERMRIDSSGNLLVGTTTSNGKVTVQQSGSGDVYRANIGTGGSAITVVGSGTTMTAGYFVTSSGVAGQILCNTLTTTYATASDYRLKENVTPIANALESVCKLKPVTYDWIVNGISSQGFIAHELQEICPEAVVGEKDAVNEDGSIKAQGIDTSFLVATLVAAIQEQQAIIDNLTTRLTALENK